ncbi:hypothetical protein KVH22_25280 [Streptomyces olivaceus]|uniref:hypothetical protein n=1 Tax=Streptomyces olivaceus TaxID=47716 RepID=UPI001CCB6DC6|nr:hypothetical protein [Streptomyces olivaceus]MBZ6258831.1 hypothetical protein [Streptomyces olivaceus]
MTTTPAPACAAATCTRSLRPHETDTGQHLCTPCVDLIGVWLQVELPRQIIVLEASRQRETTGASTGGRTVHRTAPLPGRDDILNLLGPAAWTDHIADPYGQAAADQHGTIPILGVLIPWTRTICDTRRWNPPALTPTALAAWLARPRVLDWAARQPWAGDLRDELHQLMRTVRATTRLRPQRRPVPQPCPRCDDLTLVATDHQLYIECTDENCRAMFTRDELALAARLDIAAGSRVCLTKHCAGTTYDIPTGRHTTRIHYCAPAVREGAPP